MFRPFRRFLLIASLLILCEHATAGERPRLRTLDVSRIAEIVQTEITAGKLPGAVVLIGQDDRVVYNGAFGERAIQPQPAPMTADTIFDLASLTKPIATATAVMQLVEQGRLRLDDPAAKYWPRFALNGKGAITIRHLLTHYSGLRPDLELTTRWTGYDTALAKIAGERPLRTPGTAYTYSDINFEVLGEIVRRVSGMTLDRYCAEKIFAPLGMRDTGFKPGPELRARIAPTEYREGRLLRGDVHDPTAYRMRGVAGHAGLFSTASDLAIFAQMLLDGGSAGGLRILNSASVGLMTSRQSPAGQSRWRGLGWDLVSPMDSAAAFLPGSFGHTGYTGTSIWIDPQSRTYLIILSNRVHPNGSGDVQPLRAKLAELVEQALRQPAESEVLAARRSVETGIDVLAADGFSALQGLRVGIITNQSGVDSKGRRTLDLLREAAGVRVAAIFSPEHGLFGSAEGKVADGVDGPSRTPIFSLYGNVRRPTERMLDGLDALVFDIQDAGARFYTYSTTMAYAMEAAAKKGIAFYVLDRPNPITGSTVQGPLLDPALTSFTGYFPLPVRHGMTIGELAELFNAENRIGVRLTVMTMRGYDRRSWYDATGLPWVPPSPNLRNITEAALYPGVALVEGANVSVGRGTDSPFELVGAPWIDGVRLAAYLNTRNIKGVAFAPATFTPDQAIYGGRLCRGIRITVLDRDSLDAPALGVELAAALHRQHRATFAIDKTVGMIGAPWVVDAIRSGTDPKSIIARWKSSLDAFLNLREKHLLYR